MLDKAVFPNLNVHHNQMGTGVYTSTTIHPGNTIYTLNLEDIHNSQLMSYEESYGECLNRSLGIAKDLVWCPKISHPFYHHNHGCRSLANCGLTNWGKITETNEIPIIAYTQIAAGEQILLYYPSITATYDGTPDGEPWIMECLCGAKDCQHFISSFAALPKNEQRDYLFTLAGNGSIMSHLLETLPELTKELAQRFPQHYHTYQEALERQAEYVQYWQTKSKK